MKKVLIARNILTLLKREFTFLDRSDLQVFVTATSDEALAVHRAEGVDLIVTRQDLPGMACSELCRIVREDRALRAVSIIIACANTPEAIADSVRCRANSVLLDPLHPVLVTAKAEQLLDVAARETLRVLLTADVAGQDGDGCFYCRTSNISSSGMLIETGKRLAAAARLSCRFTLPGGHRIQASGKVVRVVEPALRDSTFQYGLMFTDIAAEDRLLLEEYVAATSDRQHGQEDSRNDPSRTRA